MVNVKCVIACACVCLLVTDSIKVFFKGLCDTTYFIPPSLSEKLKSVQKNAAIEGKRWEEMHRMMERRQKHLVLHRSNCTNVEK